MKIFSSLFIFAIWLSPTLSEAGFSMIGKCVGDGAKYIKNGRDGKDIKPALNAISAAAGKQIKIYSCYRTQEYQNKLLRQRGCAPFGPKNCSQTTARHSAHTYTIAADIKKFESNPTRQCQIIAKGRAVAGGGGVGTYPKGDGHFDLGRTRSWNRCRGVVSSGESYQSPAVQNFMQRGLSSAARKCYSSQRYPSCCGPIRAQRGLCSG